MNGKIKYSKWQLFIALLCLPFMSMSQTNQQDNFHTYRIQYLKFNWESYETKKATFFVQQDAEPILRILVEDSTDIFKQVEDTLQWRLEKKPNIIIYNSYSAYQQSNIGHFFEQVNPAGQIEFRGNKIILFYEGSKELLLKQLRKELYSFIIQRQLYGSQLNEVIQNTTKGQFPGWLIEGIIQFESNGWDANSHELLQKFLFTGKQKSFDDVIMWNPQLAGTAWCQYISSTYGKHTLIQLLFQLRSNRNADKAIRQVFKKPLAWLQQSTLAYFAEHYEKEKLNIESSQKSTSSKFKLGNFSKAYGETNLLLIGNNPPIAIYENRKNDKFGLYAKVIDSKTKEKVRRLFRIPNSNQTVIHKSSILVQHPTNPLQFVWIGHVDERTELHEWVLFKDGRVKEHTTRVLKFIDGVRAACYGSHKDELFLSAYLDGQCDLYQYRIKKGTIEQITDDAYDEFEICMVNLQGQKGILMLTNNPSDTIQLGNEKLGDSSLAFQWLSMEQIEQLKSKFVKDKQVKQISLTKFQEVHHLAATAQNNVYFISKHNGFNDLFSFDVESNLVQDSIGIRGIDHYKVNDTGLVISFSQMQDSLSIDSISPNQARKLNKAFWKMEAEKPTSYGKIDSLAKGITDSANTASFFSPNQTEILNYQSELRKDKTFNREKIKPYTLQFEADELSALLDNNVLITQFQPYSIHQGQFRQSPIGGMMKFSFADLFEDHRFSVGFKVPSTNSGSDVFANYVNYKQRLDWGVTLLRHVEKFTLPSNQSWYSGTGYLYPPYVKQKTHYLQLNSTYPFNRRKGLSMALGLRHDRQIFLATDTTSLIFPDTSQLWSMIKVQYQIDQSKETIPYVRVGWRATFFGEFQYQLAETNTGFTHIGFDVRAYLPIYRNIVWAHKFSSAISGGGESLGVLYTLGGPTNGIGTAVDTSAIFAQNDNYNFVSYATNLRGYSQNIRYGNFYGLYNSELRIPVLYSLNLKKTGLNSINHLQLVPFFDIGNAWKVPASKSIHRFPWAIGYGIGLRTSLLNYFIRFECAWQNSYQYNQRTPQWSWSLGREF